jgi:CDP-diacylglycerol--glycerol-3-phosphate 3-phosphatidyltransferase
VSTYLQEPAAALLTRLGVSPNAITLSGLLVAGAGAYLLSAGQLALGGAVLLASGVFDLLDGAVARATGRVTRFGALLDSVVDRVSEAAILLGLLVFYLGRPPSFDSDLGASLVFVALAGSVMVSYIRARAEGLGVECKLGVMTRPERVVTLGVGLVVGQWWLPAVSVALGAIAALTIVTSVQRVTHVRRVLGQRERVDSSSNRDDE